MRILEASLEDLSLTVKKQLDFENLYSVDQLLVSYSLYASDSVSEHNMIPLIQLTSIYSYYRLNSGDLGAYMDYII